MRVIFSGLTKTHRNSTAVFMASLSVWYSLIQVELHTSVLFYPVCVFVTVCSHMNLSFLWVHKAKLIFMKTEMMKQSSSSVWLFAFIQVAASVSIVLLTHCSSSQPCTATHPHTQLCVLKIHVQSHTHGVFSYTHICQHDGTEPCKEWDCCYVWDKDRVASSFTTACPGWTLSSWYKPHHRSTGLYWHDEPPHNLPRRSWTEIWGETET